MQIDFNLSVVLLFIVIAQSVFAAVMLLFSSNNKVSGRLLATLIFTMALWLSDNFLRLSGIYHQRPNLYFLPIFYSFGFGPLIWFYVCSLISHPFVFKRVYLLHFTPVLLQACLYFILSLTSYPFKSWYWDNVHRPYTYRLEFDGTWLSLSVYLIMSIRLLLRYQVWLNNNFSEVSKIRLNWLKIILAVLLVLSLQWFVEVLLREVWHLYFNYDYSVGILGIIVLILGVAGIRQANLAEINFETEEQAPQKITFATDANILLAIGESMDKKQLFLNPTLSLVDLAKALKLNPKLVSRHINAGFNKSFNDYVNGYRVAEVKRRLQTADLEKLTILGIAYDSGFNSKTTFHRIFREVTGMAPSHFIRQ